MAKRIGRTVTLLACLMLPALAHAANRLSLWVTESIAQPGFDMGRCFLPESKAAGPPELPAKVSLTLTEDDVESYARDVGRWLLDSKRVSGDAARQTLTDRCFVLAIDGRVVSSGVVLHSHSPRLVGGPSLFVYDSDGRITLQLVSSSHGAYMRLLLLRELALVFDQKPAPKPGVP